MKMHVTKAGTIAMVIATFLAFGCSKSSKKTNPVNPAAKKTLPAQPKQPIANKPATLITTVLVADGQINSWGDQYDDSLNCVQWVEDTQGSNTVDLLRFSAATCPDDANALVDVNARRFSLTFNQPNESDPYTFNLESYDGKNVGVAHYDTDVGVFFIDSVCPAPASGNPVDGCTVDFTNKQFKDITQPSGDQLSFE